MNQPTPMPTRVAQLLGGLQLGLCGRCGRARYSDRRTARQAARIAAPGVRLRAYRCGDDWHLTTPNGHQQRTAPPVTMPPHTLRIGRARLDRGHRDKRAYRRPGPQDRAGLSAMPDVAGGRGGLDPLEEAHDTGRTRLRRGSFGGVG